MVAGHEPKATLGGLFLAEHHFQADGALLLCTDPSALYPVDVRFALFCVRNSLGFVVRVQAPSLAHLAV